MVYNLKYHTSAKYGEDNMKISTEFSCHLMREGKIHPRKEPENERDIGVVRYVSD